MLSFQKEAVVVQPQASLLAGTIASRPAGALSPQSSGFGARGRGSRSDSVGLGGVTSQRQVFTVAQVLTAVVAEACPGEHLAAPGAPPPATDAERWAAAAALVDAGRFDLRVSDDDGSVDPDFPPIDNRCAPRARRAGGRQGREAGGAPRALGATRWAPTGG